MEKKHIFPIDLSFSSFQGEKRPRVTGHGSCLVPRNRHWPGDRRSFAARRPTESAREEVPTGHGAPRIGRAPKSGHPNFPQPQNSGFLSSLCHQASESWKETDSRRHAKLRTPCRKIGFPEVINAVCWQSRVTFLRALEPSCGPVT